MGYFDEPAIGERKDALGDVEGHRSVQRLFAMIEDRNQ